MQHAAKSPATVNADFATAIIMRAADILEGAASEQGDNPNAYEALQKARDEFVAGHLHRDEKGRTYGWPQLVNDLRRYLEAHGIVAPGTWGNITRWSTGHQPQSGGPNPRGCRQKSLLQIIMSAGLVPLFSPVAFGRYHWDSRCPSGGYDFIGVIGFVRRRHSASIPSIRGNAKEQSAPCLQ